MNKQDRLNQTLRKKIKIAVIGGSSVLPYVAKQAYDTGLFIAKSGAILVCGGLGGVMLEAAKGAKDAGGITIGILPGNDYKQANPYIDIAIATGFGHARNIAIIQSSDGAIAIDGNFGTLSEISFGFISNIPLVGIETWRLWNPEGTEIQIKNFNVPQEAVKYLISEIKSGQKY